MASLCHLCSEIREVPSRQKLDLKAQRELGVDLIKDLFYRAGILDQGVDRTQQKILHAEKLIGSAGQVQGGSSASNMADPIEAGSNARSSERSRFWRKRG
jgi:hypothetical protein